jgi:hypothetical protein
LIKRKSNRGRPGSSKQIEIVELNEVYKGYAEAAARVNGNRGCVYLCCNNPQGRKKHKGYTFQFYKTR